MGFKSFLSKPFANIVVKHQQKWINRSNEVQMDIMKDLVATAKSTKFGKDHGLSSVQSYKTFTEQVPIVDYEGIKPYIELVKDVKSDILWPGKPAYLSKTSGTTSGIKYIPITKDSIPNHINSARNALLNYIHETGNSQFIDGKLIFLSGSPTLASTNGIPTGRLSGIVNHHVPDYLKSNQLPNYETNCIEDWEDKLDRVIEETLNQNMTLISGIPPWVQMYFDKIEAKTGKKIKDVFPSFSVFVYGGVNFAPYQNKLFDSIGKKIDSIETYPASEGFIAFQDSQESEGLLLNGNSGIFFEFIKVEDYYNENPTRVMLDQVEIGVNYALIINSNAGLWGYSIGDTVKFISLDPPRLLVTGRIKHFISAFGEHVIGQEVEKAMKMTMNQFTEVELVEFTVAPQVSPIKGLPLHEWYVEFNKGPIDLIAFEKTLNLHLQKLNTYYDDLITGNILRNLKVISLEKNAFINYMKAQGKLGGQNKVPRLSNDRKIAMGLSPFISNNSK